MFANLFNIKYTGVGSPYSKGKNYTTESLKITRQLNSLLQKYDKIIILTLYVDYNDTKLKNAYNNHINKHNDNMFTVMHKHFFTCKENINLGFELIKPDNMITTNDNSYDTLLNFTSIKSNRVHTEDISASNKIDFKIYCSARMYFDTDASNNLKQYNTGYFVVTNSTEIMNIDYEKRLMLSCPDDTVAQIYSPGFVPILVRLVNTKTELNTEGYIM